MMTRTSTYEEQAEDEMFADDEIEILIDANKQRANVGRVPGGQGTFRHVSDLCRNQSEERKREE